jgi:hypothetical protein
VCIHVVMYYKADEGWAFVGETSTYCIWIQENSEIATIVIGGEIGDGHAACSREDFLQGMQLIGLHGLFWQ